MRLNNLSFLGSLNKIIYLNILLPLFLFVCTSSYSATYVVDNIASDADDGVYTAGNLTLREAINLANGGAGGDIINFNLPVTSSITITSALPTITTSSLTINGFALGGTANATSIFSGALNPTYNIIIANGGGVATAFTISGNYNTIYGLTIPDIGDGTVSPNDIAVTISGNYNTIKGCFIGMSTNGTTKSTTTMIGVKITGANNNIGDGTIGGVNLISGFNSYTTPNPDEGGYGVYITGASATGNIIKGNVLGLQKNGTTSAGSGTQAGIYIESSSGSNVIGGTGANERNLISGNWWVTTSNLGYGILLDGSSSNSIYQNFIGPAYTGTALATSSNQSEGVRISNSGNNTIGGSSVSYRNVISGNTVVGVKITGALATANTIKGNYIGCASNGTAKITSTTQDIGIHVTGSAANNTIGGTNTGEGNLISGHGFNFASTGIGVCLNGNSNLVVGNYIGPQYDGTASMTHEQYYGVYIDAADNIIGGIVAGARNVISGQKAGGFNVYLTGASATGNIIKGNYIGPNAAGTALLTGMGGQHPRGISLNSSANYNIIGGSTPEERNVISGNSSPGITLASNNNIIAGNYIGTQANGTGAIATNPQSSGIMVTGGSYNTIGGVSPAYRNIIVGSAAVGAAGINFISSSTGNVIKANYIGVGSDGSTVVAASPYGIFVSNAVNCSIGGSLSDEANIVSGNSSAQIRLESTSNNITIKGNIIGLAADGVNLLSSSGDYGIYCFGSNNNVIGGTGTYERNFISGNNIAGIYILGASSSSNVIKGNYIGTATDGVTFVSGNTQDYGIYCFSTAPAITIGGINPGEGNVISGNTACGINIENSGNSVYGNIIGAKATGTTALDATNNQNYGIYINNKANTIIGGTTSGRRNTISDNTIAGIYITGASATATVIRGNYIGVASDGTSSITSSSQDYGIYITTTAKKNTIGGSLSGELNKIAYNTADGIYITGAGTSGNLISRNLIYANGSLAINNISSGNVEYALPTVDANFTSTTASGTAQAGDVVEVFESIISSSVTTTLVCQSAEVYLGTAVADGSGAWSLTFGSTLSTNGTPIATARHPSNNNTSEFGCPTSISLPIELMFFNAKKLNENAAKTYWQTASEINNNYFTVERSINGIDFDLVGTVKGAGNSTSVLSYQLTDEQIGSYSQLNTIYYRLKQTDFDGAYSYSNIVAVELDGNTVTSDVKIFPNPNSGDFFIQLNGWQNETASVSIKDILGKIIFQQSVTIPDDNNPIYITNAANLRSGTYIITVSGKESIANLQLIIK